MNDDQFFKICVDLEPISDGRWPPSSAEWLWCKHVGDDLYRVDNVPIFARAIAVDDVVRARVENDHLEFIEVVAIGGHSTFRVYLFTKGTSLEDEPNLLLWRQLADLGCTYEGYAALPIFAIDVPSREVLNTVKSILVDGENEGIWDYDEGVVRS
jgi:hypothetical protein